MNQEIEDKLTEVAKRIHYTASRVEGYRFFFGDLSEHLIKLELNFKGHLRATVKSIRESFFR